MNFLTFIPAAVQHLLLHWQEKLKVVFLKELLYFLVRLKVKSKMDFIVHAIRVG